MCLRSNKHTSKSTKKRLSRRRLISRNDSNISICLRNTIRTILKWKLRKWNGVSINLWIEFNWIYSNKKMKYPWWLYSKTVKFEPDLRIFHRILLAKMYKNSWLQQKQTTTCTLYVYYPKKKIPAEDYYGGSKQNENWTMSSKEKSEKIKKMQDFIVNFFFHFSILSVKINCKIKCKYSICTFMYSDSEKEASFWKKGMNDACALIKTH